MLTPRIPQDRRGKLPILWKTGNVKMQTVESAKLKAPQGMHLLTSGKLSILSGYPLVGISLKRDPHTEGLIV